MIKYTFLEIFIIWIYKQQNEIIKLFCFNLDICYLKKTEKGLEEWEFWTGEYWDKVR